MYQKALERAFESLEKTAKKYNADAIINLTIHPIFHPVKDKDDVYGEIIFLGTMVKYKK
jgi:uncharacterized protein YbjQ (UPF0145 family)